MQAEQLPQLNEQHQKPFHQPFPYKQALFQSSSHLQASFEFLQEYSFLYAVSLMSQTLLAYRLLDKLLDR